MTETDDLVVERRVSVPPTIVFAYFTDAAKWMAWQGTEAEIELEPGGTWRVNVTGDGFASGRVVEVVENERVVFTWGWEGEGPPVPPGSSTVVIELVPDGDGTLIRLTHRDLPPEEIEIHRLGWEHYSARLAAVAEGRDPGRNRLGD
ncbi:MAG: SRPBCC family protein [Actinomycetota bacterium]